VFSISGMLITFDLFHGRTSQCHGRDRLSGEVLEGTSFAF
jgi:hypothetical protein